MQIEKKFYKDVMFNLWWVWYIPTPTLSEMMCGEPRQKEYLDSLLLRIGGETMYYLHDSLD